MELHLMERSFQALIKNLCHLLYCKQGSGERMSLKNICRMPRLPFFVMIFWNLREMISVNGLWIKEGLCLKTLLPALIILCCYYRLSLIFLHGSNWPLSARVQERWDRKVSC